jgi:hypothetical protein
MPSIESRPQVYSFYLLGKVREYRIFFLL